MHELVSLYLISVVIAAVIAVYLLPALVAWHRNAPDLAAVVVVNFTLGWTVLGWWVALALALRKARPPVVQTFSQVNAPTQPLPPNGYCAPHPFADDSHSDPRWPPANGAQPPVP